MATRIARSVILPAPECSRRRTTQRRWQCVAALVYIYDHAAHDLSSKLVKNFHDPHGMSLVTLHIHLDNVLAWRSRALRGHSREVKHFSDHIMAERGVRHGQPVMVPAEKASKRSGTSSRKRKKSE